MSDLTMWFGTRGYMQWVPCPLVDSDMSKVGWQSSAQYLNGGTRVRSSVTAHKEYNLAWGLQERDNIRTITDYADGVYGDENIYFIDPFAADKNVLPQYWAAPALGIEDAPVLSGVAKPSIIETDSNSNKYPRYSAVYFIEPTDAKKDIYIPIPPGYQALVGVHGSRPDDSSAYVRVRYTVGGTGYGAATSLPILSVDTDTRFSNIFDPNETTNANGIVLDLQGTGTLILSGLMVQIVRTDSSASGLAAVRTNLATNPSFEAAATGWAVTGSATISKDTTTFFSGASSLKVVTSGAAVYEGAYSPTAVVAGLVAGSNFSGSAMVKAPAGTLMRVSVSSLGAGAVNANNFYTATGDWQLIKGENATLGASLNPYLAVLTGNSAQAVTFYVDNVMLEMGATVGDYFDGSNPDLGGYCYTWNGTANASTSTVVKTQPGGFISGQGHSGCKFAEQPKLQNYSSAMDKSALTAKLVEVGAWA